MQGEEVVYRLALQRGGTIEREELGGTRDQGGFKRGSSSDGGGNGMGWDVKWSMGRRRRIIILIGESVLFREIIII